MTIRTHKIDAGLFMAVEIETAKYAYGKSRRDSKRTLIDAARAAKSEGGE